MELSFSWQLAQVLQHLTAERRHLSFMQMFSVHYAREHTAQNGTVCIYIISEVFLKDISNVS